MCSSTTKLFLGGGKWREMLRASAGACRVVICLVTEEWLLSDECFNEFRAAWYMGKRIIPLFLLTRCGDRANSARLRLQEIRAEDQGVDLRTCISASRVLDPSLDPSAADQIRTGLRAAGALNDVGLDPEAFAIDRIHRPTPFSGLASFGDDDADAALFYGRSREILEGMEELRTMRATGDRRPLVILGASGAGKSSLLKAGIIPRLRRESAAWLPLRAFRPGADPLLNFAEALSRTFADYKVTVAAGTVRDRLFDAWANADRDEAGKLSASGQELLASTLGIEGKMLRTAAARPNATILISVDQAEEFARSEGQSGEALSDYLRLALKTEASHWQLVFSIRTDSFPELQNHARFRDMETRGFDLRAIALFRLDDLIVEPARRYGVQIDDELVHALVEDAPRNDALPLLAFTLQRLWQQYADAGVLTKANYDRGGGLRGLLEDAAERALKGIEPHQDVPLSMSSPTKQTIQLAASAFVPAMAQINEQGATIRRVADWMGFSEEQQEILTRFDRWRLVVRKGTESGGGTLEVAHEALFREWTRLNEWLEPERARLEALRSVHQATATWRRQGMSSVFLDHRDSRLAEAIELLGDPRYSRRLSSEELSYISACRMAEGQERRRRKQGQSLIAILAIVLAVGVLGWLNQTYLAERVNWFATMRPYMLTSVRPHVLTTGAEHALKAKDTFRECAKDCPTMVVVPAGHFMMGSAPESDQERDADEGPVHSVHVENSFAVSKYLVTFDDWDACVSVGGCPQVADGGFGRGSRPVINVTWADAKRYARWLSDMTGKSYRLLTEAEWEYAARGETKSLYYWGDQIGSIQCEL